MKNNRGLNAIRIHAESAGAYKPGGYNANKIDKIVDLADQNDLYVIITPTNAGLDGGYNQAFLTQFWDFYAPRYKDRTHVVYEVMNEPQHFSAPYTTTTLTMEKNAYDQIRSLAPDTHIMMMSYGKPTNWTKAADECGNLAISWSNASVAFHAYGIEGMEDSALTSFYDAMKSKDIAYSCTEASILSKAILTQLIVRDGVSQMHDISVHDISTNTKSFYDWIDSSKICWTPDFGTWPSCGSTSIINNSSYGVTAVNISYHNRKIDCLGRSISETSGIPSGAGFFIYLQKRKACGVVNFDKLRY